MADTTVVAAETWILRHERLIIIVLALVFLGWIGSKWIDHSATVDKQKAVVAQQELADQKDKDSQLAAQVKQSTTEYQQLVTQLAQQNQQLAANITQRNTALIVQQASDQKLTNPQVATRWQQVAPNVAPNAVTPTATGVEVTQQGARDTVAALEQIPVLQKDLKDSQQEFTNQQQELDKSNQLVSQLNLQVTGLGTQITDGQKACKAEITSVKADARKGKMKWFKIGFVTGFVSGLWVSHATGL